ncbi:MAG: PIN domain protein [Deltaproteobacteria bacterium]|nr:PIN domain protein [Deltaproteobacteria bacterium]
MRIYADTSVFGGCFDEDFEQDSIELFDEIRNGRFILILSTTTMRELERAPEQVRQVVAGLPPEQIEMQELSDEIERLRDAYLDAGVVGPASKLDAEHVACATVALADLIVSWNFKHIVHFDRIRAYHSVNLVQGYRPIPIHSPKEVIET